MDSGDEIVRLERKKEREKGTLFEVLIAVHGVKRRNSERRCLVFQTIKGHGRHNGQNITVKETD